ncbi:MAG: hypothetical protein HQK89_08210 [Nitrospirae bacterium]|nr:hypothetical protein [Nitrospirota bacterium]
MMRTKLLAILLFVCMVFAGFGLAQAATSQLDNQPGGAAVVYWQASPTTPATSQSGWQTLVDVQEVNSQCARVHWEIYDQNSNEVIDFSTTMTAQDNMAINITMDTASTIRIDFYSPTATPLTLLPVTVSPDGIARGYVTAVRDNAACPVGTIIGGPGGGVAQTGTITGGMVTAGGSAFIVGNAVNCQSNGKCLIPDALYVTAAYLKGSKAFAVPAAMLQGFVVTGNNPIETIADDDWIDTTTRPDSGTTCDFDQNNSLTGTFSATPQSNGQTVSFVSLFQTDNVFAPVIGATTTGQRYRTVCNGGQNAVPAFGSANGFYVGRFNASTTNGTGTLLLGVMPATTDPAVCQGSVGTCGIAHFSRIIYAVAMDDAENGLSTTFLPPEAFAIPFGTSYARMQSPVLGNTVAGNVGSYINIPANTADGGAGDVYLAARAPLYGFTYTEGSATVGPGAYADVYPLGRPVAVYLPNVVYNQPGTNGAAFFSGAYVAPAIVDPAQLLAPGGGATCIPGVGLAPVVITAAMAALGGNTTGNVFAEGCDNPTLQTAAGAAVRGAAQLVTDYGPTTVGHVSFGPRGSLAGGVSLAATDFRDAQLSDNSSTTPPSSGLFGIPGFGSLLPNPWIPRNRQTSYQENPSCADFQWLFTCAPGFACGCNGAQFTGNGVGFVAP